MAVKPIVAVHFQSSINFVINHASRINNVLHNSVLQCCTWLAFIFAFEETLFKVQSVDPEHLLCLSSVAILAQVMASSISALAVPFGLPSLVDRLAKSPHVLLCEDQVKVKILTQCIKERQHEKWTTMIAAKTRATAMSSAMFDGLAAFTPRPFTEMIGDQRIQRHG